ncbi:MAG: PAS domain-containing protein [Rhodobacteraceae bacterium]|nr:PAS domain-containing protein [Paracoccaceae bacterium]
MPDSSLISLLDDDRAFEGFSRAQVGMVLTNPNLEDNPIVYVNEAFQRITGYSRTATIGRNCRFLQGEGSQKSDVDKLHKAVESREDVAVDILNYRANGQPFINRLIVAPINDQNGETLYFIGIQKEIRSSDRDAGPDLVNAQLAEIQNRVCDDLSMIISMIQQQSRSTTAPEDFAALARRIESLQLLYEEMKLSDTKSNRDQVQLGSFLSRMASAIAHVDGKPGIRMTSQIDPLLVPIETATRVGLVLSEVLTNAFRHAFDRLDAGLVEVRMSRLSEGGLRLTVADDGVGISRDTKWPDNTSTGGRIVSGLIEGLEGTLSLTRGAAGTIITIDVPAGASATD